jgi:hypothetical protein
VTGFSLDVVVAVIVAGDFIIDVNPVEMLPFLSSLAGVNFSGLGDAAIVL